VNFGALLADSDIAPLRVPILRRRLFEWELRKVCRGWPPVDLNVIPFAFPSCGEMTCQRIDRNVTRYIQAIPIA
jgi:hypothetical protein